MNENKKSFDIALQGATTSGASVETNSKQTDYVNLNYYITKPGDEKPELTRQQYQKDKLYEAICQAREMLDADRQIGDIIKYLKSITGKENYGMTEIYALAYCYDFMDQIK